MDRLDYRIRRGRQGAVDEMRARDFDLVPRSPLNSVQIPPKANNPPWIKALAEVRRLAPREGWRYHHVQAIIVSIDQYAEAALGNREFFLNKPYGIGGGMKDNIP
jgi:hypothetical protein